VGDRKEGRGIIVAREMKLYTKRKEKRRKDYNKTRVDRKVRY